VLRHEAGHGALGEEDAELQELAVDARRLRGELAVAAEEEGRSRSK
jgi:hypothetical protein